MSTKIEIIEYQVGFFPKASFLPNNDQLDEVINEIEVSLDIGSSIKQTFPVGQSPRILIATQNLQVLLANEKINLVYSLSGNSLGSLEEFKSILGKFLGTKLIKDMSFSRIGWVDSTIINNDDPKYLAKNILKNGLVDSLENHSLVLDYSISNVKTLRFEISNVINSVDRSKAILLKSDISKITDISAVRALSEVLELSSSKTVAYYKSIFISGKQSGKRPDK